jgi:pimeloyl-ACP methyl ester carboxylesterase
MHMPESQFVTAEDGARIAYRVYGAGEPTVLLSNGIGCNQAYVDHLIRDLAQRHRTVIWDYRGHVDSDPPADPRELTVEVCLQDLHAVAQAIGAERTVLAGFSMGVQIGLEYLHRHPQGICGFLALLGTYEYPLRSFFHMGRLGERVVPGLLRAVRSQPELMQRVWSTVLSGPWVFPAAQLLVLNRKAARRDDFESWRRHLAGTRVETFLQLGIYLGAHSAAHALEAAARIPCLIVAGDRDNFTPIRVCRRMHERIPGSEWVEICGASHGGLFEFPEQINPRVLEFMQRHFPRP